MHSSRRQQAGISLPVDDPDPPHQIADALTVAAAVHHHQTAEGAGDADDVLEAGKTGALRLPGQARHPHPRFGSDAAAGNLQGRKARAEFEDDTPKPGIVEEQVAPLADHQQRQAVGPGILHHAAGFADALRLHQQVGGTADAPGAVGGKRRIGGYRHQAEPGQIFEHAGSGKGHGGSWGWASLKARSGGGGENIRDAPYYRPEPRPGKRPFTRPPAVGIRQSQPPALP